MSDDHDEYEPPICGFTLIDGRRYYCSRYKSCPLCSRFQAKTVASNIANNMATSSSLYHVTLTLPYDYSPIRQQQKTLTKSFAALRRQLSRTSKIGGCWNLHAKHDADGFVVHLHAIIDTLETLEPSNIQFQWLKITGGNSDCRLIDSKEYQHNASRYVSKPANTDFADDPDTLREFAIQAKGMQLRRNFGTWIGTPLSKRPRPATNVHAVALNDALKAILNPQSDTTWTILETSRTDFPPSPSLLAPERHNAKNAKNPKNAKKGAKGKPHEILSHPHEIKSQPHEISSQLHEIFPFAEPIFHTPKKARLKDPHWDPVYDNPYLEDYQENR